MGGGEPGSSGHPQAEKGCPLDPKLEKGCHPPTDEAHWKCASTFHMSCSLNSLKGVI